MKKYVILIPIYNDRESLNKLIENINSEIEGINSEISIIVINDASSQQIIDDYFLVTSKKLKFIFNSYYYVWYLFCIFKIKCILLKCFLITIVDDFLIELLAQILQ